MTADDFERIVAVGLTDTERELLSVGLNEWGGPAHCTDEMAIAMGFDDVAHLFREGDRISRALESGAPLSRRDWTRALLATEIAFASDVLGSGRDWSITTGFDDVVTLGTLRTLQVKLVAVVIRPQRGS